MRSVDAERILGLAVTMLREPPVPRSRQEFEGCLAVSDSCYDKDLSSQGDYITSLGILDALWTCLAAGRFGELGGSHFFGEPCDASQATECYQRAAGTLISHYRRLMQSIYDLSDDDLPPELAEGERGEGLLLYVRPLFANARYAIPNRFTTPYRMAFHREPPFITVEQALERVFAPPFTNFSIGGPVDSLGMTRLIADEGFWKQLVESCIETVRVIFATPSDTEGVRWELGRIRDKGHLKKTVLIMLPRVDGHESLHPYFEDDYDGIPAAWEAARDLCGTLHIELPEYQPAGAFLLMDGDGGIDRRFDFASFYTSELREEILRRFG